MRAIPEPDGPRVPGSKAQITTDLKSMVWEINNMSMQEYAKKRNDLLAAASVWTKGNS